MSTKTCQCPTSDEPFTCSLTGCEMTRHQQHLCQSRRKYREFFQERKCDQFVDATKMVNSPEIPDGSQVKKQRSKPPRKNGAQKVPKQLRSLGPGGHLKKLLAELGVKTGSSCGCNSFASKMDAWGVEGCRFHRPEIVEHLKSQATWREKITVAIGAVTTAATWLNPLDAAGSLLDEALRRAEESLRATMRPA